MGVQPAQSKGHPATRGIPHLSLKNLESDLSSPKAGLLAGLSCACMQGAQPMVSVHLLGMAGIWEGPGEQVCSANAGYFSVKLMQSFSKSVSWLT